MLPILSHVLSELPATGQPLCASLRANLHTQPFLTQVTGVEQNTSGEVRRKFAFRIRLTILDS